MNGFVEHLINSDAEVQDELTMQTLNESCNDNNVDCLIDDELEFDDEFSNEEEPGDFGGNVDGITNLGDDVDSEMDDDDEWEEHSSDPTDDLEGFDDLDEACQQTMQACHQTYDPQVIYQGFDDEDLEDEELFQECLDEAKKQSGWQKTKRIGKKVINTAGKVALGATVGSIAYGILKKKKKKK